MSSGLVLIDEYTVPSPVATVTLGAGSNGSAGNNVSIDTTYNVYQVIISGVKVSADDALSMRVTKSTAAQDDTNYDEIKEYIKSDAAVALVASSGSNTQIDITATIDSGESASSGNAILTLFNFPNADEFSYITLESVHYQYNDNAARGFYGSITHNVASACDGIQFKTNGGNNITAGKFTLYGLNK